MHPDFVLEVDLLADDSEDVATKQYPYALAPPPEGYERTPERLASDMAELLSEVRALALRERDGHPTSLRAYRILDASGTVIESEDESGR